MKNDALNKLKEMKKKVDLQNGKHICMFLVWFAVYLVVWFQPESTLRTWVLIISAMAIVHRIWAQGRCSGARDSLNALIEGFSKKETSADTLTGTFQEVGSSGIELKIENKKAKEDQK